MFLNIFEMSENLPLIVALLYSTEEYFLFWLHSHRFLVSLQVQILRPIYQKPSGKDLVTPRRQLFENSCCSTASVSSEWHNAFMIIWQVYEKFILICEGMRNPPRPMWKKTHPGLSVFSLNFICSHKHFQNGWINSNIQHWLGMSVKSKTY